MSDYWNYIVTIVGLTGFYLAGKKVWWCWYVNIFNQILWFTFGFVTEQWGFVLGTFVYTAVFVKNAISWTKEHYGIIEPVVKTREELLVDHAEIQQWRITNPPFMPHHDGNNGPKMMVEMHLLMDPAFAAGDLFYGPGHLIKLVAPDADYLPET